MKILNIKLSEKEIEEIKNCYSYTFCTECDCRSDCVISRLNDRLDKTAYNLYDLFKVLNKEFDWEISYV